MYLSVGCHVLILIHGIIAIPNLMFGHRPEQRGFSDEPGYRILMPFPSQPSPTAGTLHTVEFYSMRAGVKMRFQVWRPRSVDDVTRFAGTLEQNGALYEMIGQGPLFDSPGWTSNSHKYVLPNPIQVQVGDQLAMEYMAHNPIPYSKLCTVQQGSNESACCPDANRWRYYNRSEYSFFATEGDVFSFNQVDSTEECREYSIKAFVRPPVICKNVSVRYHPIKIRSPTYPDPYDIDTDACWVLRSVWPTRRILVRFQDMDMDPDMECRDDFLEIRDGPSPSSDLLGRFCGSEIPKTVLSTGNSLFAYFHSDLISDTYRGFRGEHIIRRYGGSVPPGVNSTSTDSDEEDTGNKWLAYGIPSILVGCLAAGIVLFIVIRVCCETPVDARYLLDLTAPHLPDPDSPGDRFAEPRMRTPTGSMGTGSPRKTSATEPPFKGNANTYDLFSAHRAPPPSRLPPLEGLEKPRQKKTRKERRQPNQETGETSRKNSSLGDPPSLPHADSPRGIYPV